MADRSKSDVSDFANAFSDCIGGGENLISLLIQQKVLVFLLPAREPEFCPEVSTALPVKRAGPTGGDFIAAGYASRDGSNKRKPNCR